MAYNKSGKDKSSLIKIPNLGEAYLLFSAKWKEYRRTRGENADEPFVIPDTGYLTIHFPKGMEKRQVRVFVEVE